jgi:hypothetical protein
MSKKPFRTNPTGIREIDSQRVRLELKRNTASFCESFSVKHIDLDGLHLPPEGDVTVIAASTFNELRVELGKVRDVQKLCDVSLSSLDSESVSFRLIVTEPPNPQVVASCESVDVVDEIATSPLALFNVHYTDLGERMWDLQLSSTHKPVIKVHSSPRLALKSSFERRDFFVRGLILVSAFENTLVFLAMNPVTDDNPATWQNIWEEFLLERDEEIPDCEDASDLAEVQDWAKRLSLDFAHEVRFVTQHLAQQEASKDE